MARNFGRPPSTAGFQTHQTVSYYEEALSRHVQYVRWTHATRCPCIVDDARQPNPQCQLCYGEGFIYGPAKGPFQVYEEQSPHDAAGIIIPWFQPVIVGTAKARNHGLDLSITTGNQPADGLSIVIDPPYPTKYSRIWTDYEFDPTYSVVAEDSSVYNAGAFILRTTGTQFSSSGKSFYGSLVAVSRVYNSTRAETYTVSSTEREFVYLTGMGTWQSGDVLEVDYSFVYPYQFVIAGVSPKLQYQNPWVLDNADAILMSPYWAKIAPNDLFTAQAAEARADDVINPLVAGANNDDIIDAHFDLARILDVIDKNGVAYDPLSDVQIVRRNRIHWNIEKPTVPYTISYTYNPTYISIGQYSMIRTAENKEFVNRMNIILYNKTTPRMV